MSRTGDDEQRAAAQRILVAERVAAVWRIESARLVAALTRRTGDFDLAEDLAQEVFGIAVQQWPVDGVPDQPGAWLMATARHRLADHARRRTTGSRKQQIYYAGTSTTYDPDEEAIDMVVSAVRDDDLRLIFMSCHPDLPRESQIALTLKVVAGLHTSEIARAFLVSDTTVAQRIVRAKKRLKTSGARFELPGEEAVEQRLATVLAVVYAIFNEGYAATAGEQWTRPELCRDALRLGRRLATLRPDSSEVHGLLALMELQVSRLPARQAPGGEPVLLGQQDRRKWDRSSIRRGLASLQHADDLGGGPYTLQAEVAACHARAVSIETTDWARITALYTVLAHVMPSPVVELNRAAATVHYAGPEKGLRLLNAIEGLDTYPLYHVARGDAWEKLGDRAEAVGAFERATELEPNDSLRGIFTARAAAARVEDSTADS